MISRLVPWAVFWLVIVLDLLRVHVHVHVHVQAQPVIYCYDIGNFTTNSTFAQNRHQVLGSLAISASSKEGFVTSTYGDDPDEVYALALCRGDFTSDGCHGCLNASIYEMMCNCPNQREAFFFGNGDCIIHYADTNFFRTNGMSPYTSAYNPNKIQLDSDHFDEIFGNLSSSLIGNASSGSSQLKFAVGNAALSYYQDMYALVQCVPTLSSADCQSCLQEVFGIIQTNYSRVQAIRWLTPSCTFFYDTHMFYNLALSPPLPPPPSSALSPSSPTTTKTSAARGHRDIRSLIFAILIPVITFLILGVIACIYLLSRKQKMAVDDHEAMSFESLHFGFGTLHVATNGFSETNKLGEGGFGSVYKGTLSNGEAVAVKRLGSGSSQGELEFKNEVLTMARLQHKNLVRLVGFCLEGKERMVVYEFVVNASLDKFLFDPTRRLLLNWKVRYNIIRGISKGMLYLHEESRLKVIHRDLKAANVLLDKDLNPQIADFGMARISPVDHSQENTKRIAGTYGYMAPEYAQFGIMSTKSDVFSFGVLLLEIVTGRKNLYHQSSEHVENLLSYVWKYWRKGRISEVIDPVIRDDGLKWEMTQCIHIGLLCVQEHAVNRPTMAAIGLMFEGQSQSLPPPLQPAFLMHVGSSSMRPTATAELLHDSNL